MSSKGGRRQPLTPTLVRLSAVIWALVGGLAGLGSWGFLNATGRSVIYAWYVLGISLSGALFFTTISPFLKTPRRAIGWAITVGFMLAPPLLMMFGFHAFGYLLLVAKSTQVEAVEWVTVMAINGMCIGINLQALRNRVVSTRYMEHEFTEFDDYVALRWERRTAIEAPPISDNTAIGRLWNRHGSKLVVALAPLSGAGYAMSRLMDRGGGPEAVLLVLAILCMPLWVYMTSMLICGTYLNIYKVWQVERRTGKPVLFDDIPTV